MSALEAKIVVLGAQGVGKTSLVQRFINGYFKPEQIEPTVGASFLTKRVVDSDTDTIVRLQIWDTAGQERFRSISRLYYRGANACILCYSITDVASFRDMGVWLTELRKHLPHDVVLHVVGTKADIVARDPSARQVPFERCIAYVAENLAPGLGGTPPPTANAQGGASAIGGSSSSHNSNSSYHFSHSHATANPQIGTLDPHSPSSKRSSGFWGQEAGWDACHEISAESGEGVEEVFRVVARKLVEQNRKMQQALLMAMSGQPGGTPGLTPGTGYYDPSRAGTAGLDGGGGGGGYFDSQHGGGGQHPYYQNQYQNQGSFRVGKDRRSWLFSSPSFSPAATMDNRGAGVRHEAMDGTDGQGQYGGKCC